MAEPSTGDNEALATLGGAIKEVKVHPFSNPVPDDLKSNSLEQRIKGKYESFWLYPESHPWRLAQHITVRGIFTGTTLSFLVGIPYFLLRRREGFLRSLGRVTARGGIWGGIILGLITTERLYHLEKVGIEDRSYRIAYNWQQTKWDYLALSGALVGGAVLRRPFGGLVPGMAIGTVLGTTAFVGSSIYASLQKKKVKSA